MRAIRAIILPLMLVPEAPAFAHGGHDHLSESLPWTWDIWITAPLAICALVFALGWSRLKGRSSRGASGLTKRGLLFAAGWIILTLALVSPLHAAGERSFLLHMIEHEILMLVSTPLLVLAEPLPILLWAFPLRWRIGLGRLGSGAAGSATWRALCGPLGATLLQGAALWLWHAPALFNRAVENDGWHIAQHLSFVVTALLFWSAVLGRRGAANASRPAARAVAALCLFLTSLVGGALGALMAVSESPWYSAYVRLGTAPFGLSPVEDQQLAGLVMWLPGGLVHAAAALLVARTLLKPPRPSEPLSHAV